MEKREKLGAEIRFLGRVLGDVIKEQAGTALFDLEEEIRLGARARREGTPGAERALGARIRSMSDAEARIVVRAFTVFFDLMNLAEDRERVRVLRERERGRYPEPRTESMEEAVQLMQKAGLDAAGSQALLDLLSIGLVFTAHPTEAKRRSVRTKVRLLRQSLVQLDDAELLPRERDRIVTRIRSLLTGLWQTDLIRPRRPSVLEEVEVGLYFAATLWEVAPDIYAELDRALRKIYPGSAFRLPPFLGFGSWIGGDRDGNPFVSARVTEMTLLRMRASAVDAHLARCRLLFDELTTSERQAAVSWELRQAVENRVREFPETLPLLEPLSAHETYRRFLKTVEWRLQRTRAMDSLEHLPAGAYRAGADLAADLLLIRDSLRMNKGAAIVEGNLQAWLWQTEVFGLHFARLDIRQESGRNTRVVAELARALGLCPDYESLGEQQRRELLASSLGTHRELPRDSLSADALETLDACEVLRQAGETVGGEALGGNIISMTHRFSDILAALWLMELRPRLWRAADAGHGHHPALRDDHGPRSRARDGGGHAARPGVPPAPEAARRRADCHDRVLGQHEGRGVPRRLLGAVQDAERAVPRGSRARRAADLLPWQGRLAGPRRRAGRPQHPGAPAGIPRRGTANDRAGRGAGRPLRRSPHRRPPPGAGHLGHRGRFRAAAHAAPRRVAGGHGRAGSGGPGRLPRSDRGALLPGLLRAGHADPGNRIASHCLPARASHAVPGGFPTCAQSPGFSRGRRTGA